MRTERSEIEMRLRDQPTGADMRVTRKRDRERNKDPPSSEQTSLSGQAQESQPDTVVGPQDCSLSLLLMRAIVARSSYEINPYQLCVYHHHLPP